MQLLEATPNQVRALWSSNSPAHGNHHHCHSAASHTDSHNTPCILCRGRIGSRLLCFALFLSLLLSLFLHSLLGLCEIHESGNKRKKENKAGHAALVPETRSQLAFFWVWGEEDWQRKTPTGSEKIENTPKKETPTASCLQLGQDLNELIKTNLEHVLLAYTIVIRTAWVRLHGIGREKILHRVISQVEGHIPKAQKVSVWTSVECNRPYTIICCAINVSDRNKCSHIKLLGASTVQHETILGATISWLAVCE